MVEGVLSEAVFQLAETMQALSDEELDQEWVWRHHGEGVRFALLGTYHELRGLAVTLAAGRVEKGNPVTAGQHALAQYHAGYLDLRAVLLGVADGDLDLPPAKGEWPLRRVLEHIIGADRMFFCLVYYAIEQFRAKQEPARMTEENMNALVGPRAAFEQLVTNEGLAGIMDHYETLHGRILSELANLNAEETNAPSLFWEGEALPVRYRLHRFDAHLRQHTVQAEKTLTAIGHEPNESKRLLRLVYNALAEAEGMVIGDWEYGADRQSELAELIAARAEEITAAVGT